MELFFDLLWWQQVLVIYIVLLNVITFFYFGYDKMRSLKQKRRVPEKTLWLLCLFGGSIGGLVGMNYFRHKTKKISFQAGIAVIVALQIIVFLYVFII